MVKAKQKEISTNRFYLPLLFIGFAIIFEMANFMYMGFTNASGDLMVLPSYFLFDLGIILMMAGVIYVVQNQKAMLALFYIFLLLACLINITNTTMYNIFGDILSFDLLVLGTEATTALTPDIIDWWGGVLNIVIFGLAIASSIVLVKYNKKTVIIKNFSMPIFVLAVFIVIQSLGFGLFEAQKMSLSMAIDQGSEIEASDKYLWDNFQFKLDSYKKFGSYGFYTKSVLDLIFKDEIDEEDVEFLQNYIDEGYKSENPNAPLYGDNLIVILCESTDWYAIDPFNTPTLWRLANGDNTISFTEFYARNRTNNSEGIVLNGGTPRNIALKDALKNGYNFDYALPKLFETTTDEETVTTYVHCNTRDYYSRDITHIDGLGFDYMYTLEDYTGEQVRGGWGEWITDVDFTANLMDKIIPDTERFMTFIATMATHGPYTYTNPYYQEYYEIFESNYEQYSAWAEENTPFIIPTDEGDFELFYHYKSAAIDLDRTIANLIEELEKRGRAEDTSIVMFADHNVYYNDLSLKLKGIEKVDYSNTFAYNIPFMIYSPKLTNGEGYINDTFCNTYDILPTICDIYGLPSNSNLFYGYSVFSEDIENSFFASHLNGMFTNDIYSLNISDVVVMNDNVTEEDIAKFKDNATKFFKKQEYLEKIYENGINGTIDLTANYV